MPTVNVRFDDALALADIMRAVESIGCTLRGDGRGSLLVVKKAHLVDAAPIGEADAWLEHQLPGFLRREVE